MIFESVVVGSLEVNCYIVASDKGKPAAIIDPGDDEKKIRHVLDKYHLEPAMVINTHGHFDHIGCDDAFGVPVYIHTDDAGMLTDARRNYSMLLGSPYKVGVQIHRLHDNQMIKVDGLEFKVLHIPGHSAGGIALVLKKPDAHIVVSGDSLFRGSIGRSDLGGDEALLIRSIKEKLLNLPDDTVVYPGHGPISTIGEEKKNNPFLQ